MKVELWVAIYGAVTGTIAIASTIRQWWLDRAILTVKANVSIVNTDRVRVMLSVSAVNKGRRPVSISTVGALLTTDSPSTTQMMSAERSVELVKNLPCNSHSLLLFGGRDERPTQLSPDGGQETWASPIPRQMRFLGHKKGNEELGTAYVELTSGKKLSCDFPILKDEFWPNT